MAVISDALFTAYIDRIGKFYELFKNAVDTIAAGDDEDRFWDRLTSLDDRTLENDFVPTVITVDNKIGDLSAARAGASNLGTGSIIGALAQHASRQDIAGGINGLCELKDIRSSDYFNQVYFKSYNKFMLAKHVFCEDDTTFATIDITGGNLVYTNGDEYGDGETHYASGSYFAATQLKVEVDVVGGIGPGMASQLDFRLTVKDKDWNTDTINVSIPMASIVGYTADIGSSTDRFLSVTNAVFYNANTGTNGDQVTIHNKKERTVSL